MKHLKLSITVLVLVLCLVLSGVLIYDINIKPVSAEYRSTPLIIIDAGHGGLTNTIH